MKKNNTRDILLFLLIIAILVSVASFLFEGPSTEKITYADVVRQFEAENVEEYIIDGGLLTMKLKRPLPSGQEIINFDLTDPQVRADFRMDLGELLRRHRSLGIITDDDRLPDEGTPWWMMLLPYALVFVVIGLMWYFMYSKADGGASKTMRFGKARTKDGRDEKKKVTFADVAGAEEEKLELAEIVEFLKDPKKFTEIGARIPKGVLLVGPPGTGKTYIAKAVAGEAGVPFLSISGSDFVELYVGVGASRVRDLFEQAKKAAPAIIFIDEIDAVGRHRGAGYGGGHDEREQTLNQLLVEMDGFGNNEGVIIIAATNRPDILDPALMRPGRFDRQVYVGLPDMRDREKVLEIHARKKKLASDVSLKTVAKSTSGFTPADLENLLNEAALLAARRGEKSLTQDDIEKSMLKIIAGPAKKSRVRSERENKLVAYHEAGHALAMKFLPTQDPVHHISIIPRGMANGYTISLPREDVYTKSKTAMNEDIVSLLGGRVAEKLVLDDISTGASNDIQRASGIARDMVTKYGMSDRLGPISYASDRDEVFLGRDFAEKRAYSEEIAGIIDEEVREIVENAYKKCEQILNDNMDKLHEIAKFLLENETMEAEDFYALFDEKVPEREDGENAIPDADIQADKTEE
ncbi:MAG: ATP-dependent zinc metalloprotease FtsH [Oscillospiraceae bacterium]|nr:ATP-dependent zinc metalloprotease FtsH [Oscillospiraceae bacterium]